MTRIRHNLRPRVALFLKILGTLSLCLTACTTPPTVAPTATATAATSLATSASFSTPTLPAVTPTLIAANSVEVSIVEPPFKPVETWHFDPGILTVKVGAKLTWINSGAVVHTVTADDGKAFNSGDVAAKATFSFTPTAAGTWTYHCAYHPWMKGTLIVLP